MPNVIIPFTEGVEEIELVTVVDAMRRANIKVCMASLDGKSVQGRSQITIASDAAIANVMDQAWDAIVLPGGLPNAYLLAENPYVEQLCQQLAAKGNIVAAICAAPCALARFGLLKDKHATSYPGIEPSLAAIDASCQAQYEHAVVRDGNIITSQGPGTAMAFALALVKILAGADVAKDVAASMVVTV